MTPAEDCCVFPDPSCPECGCELPVRGYKVRAVPRLGGRIRKVCEPCAALIDGQARLDVLSETTRPRVRSYEQEQREAAA